MHRPTLPPEAVGSTLSPAPSDVDDFWMQRALEQAHAAFSLDEVPVGAVLVRNGVLIAEAHNRTRLDDDPTAHAEMVLLRRAAGRIGGRVSGTPESRLLDTTMYVTLEPCAMCAGGLVLAKVGRLVFGAADPKTGMCGSLGDLVRDARLNHRLTVTGGVLASASGTLLRQFFRNRRAAVPR